MCKTWKRLFLPVLILLLMITLNSCGVREEEKKVKDLSFTIVEEDKIPEELKATIEEKKEAEFKITYETENDLYIVHGYGEQETGGYSMAVKDLYLSENAVYCKTQLIGPTKTENYSKNPSYPYIVIKTENQNKNVIFD